MCIYIYIEREREREGMNIVLRTLFLAGMETNQKEGFDILIFIIQHLLPICVP